MAEDEITEEQNEAVIKSTKSKKELKQKRNSSENVRNASKKNDEKNDLIRKQLYRYYACHVTLSNSE
jgi:DNA polymerase sigma